jgi:peptidoglycan/LPS O-acetylase OafA/YrhL
MESSQNPAHRHVPSLDGLRLLAVVAIALYHAKATWLPAGFLGVTTFFVLSGYLMTSSFLRRQESGQRFDYKAFVLKRLRRLWPTMLVVIGATIVIFAFSSTFLLSKVKSDVIPALLFFENIFYIVRKVPYFAAAGLPSPLTHFWYLGVLMQISLVWPPVFLLITKLCHSRKARCIAVAALMAASTIETAVLYDLLGDTTRVYYGPDTRAGEFLVGCLLAFMTHDGEFSFDPMVAFVRSKTQHQSERVAEGSHAAESPQTPEIAYDVAGVAAVVVILIMMRFLSGYVAFVYRGGLLVVALLSAMLIGCLTRQESLLARAIGAKPLAASGKRSYSIYLWHYPLLEAMNPATRTTALPWWGWVLEALVIAVVSELSYRFIEGSPHALPTFEQDEQSREPIHVGSIKGSARHDSRKKGLFGRGESASRRHLRLSPIQALEAGCAIAIAVLMVVPVTVDTPYENERASGQEAGGGSSETVEPIEEPDPTDPETQKLIQTQDVLTSMFGIVYKPVYTLSEDGVTNADVLVIADSILGDAQDQFYHSFPNGYLDSEVGRQLTAGADAYREDVAAGHDQSIVVFELGGNGVATEEQVRELIESVDSSKQVYLITLRVPLPLQDSNNELFRRVVADYPNCHLIDWYAESEGHDEYFWDDGQHLRPEGVDAYIAMMRRAIVGA